MRNRAVRSNSWKTIIVEDDFWIDLHYEGGWGLYVCEFHFTKKITKSVTFLVNRKYINDMTIDNSSEKSQSRVHWWI